MKQRTVELRLRRLHMMRARAEYMIKFWQQEIEFCNEEIDILLTPRKETK